MARPKPTLSRDERSFDLNIEMVLEDWGVPQALREVIANAIDEQSLTQTGDIQIFEDPAGRWHIRDFGRGLKYEHLTQNESQEKLSRPHLVIGKFGVGLKDALATCDRHQIGVQIRSPHGDIRTARSPKHGFNDIKTLHAVITEPSDRQMDGTDFIFDGVSVQDVEAAKDFFLRFRDSEILAETRYGQIIANADGSGHIYIKGLLVAHEPRFLFSYNITNVTKILQSALNRERANVGRAAYADRVKDILLACKANVVAHRLAADLRNLELGTHHEELNWSAVQLHSCKVLNSSGNVLFVTAAQMEESPALLAYAKQDGLTVVVIPTALSAKLNHSQDVLGRPIRNLAAYGAERDRSFEFDYVSTKDLTVSERTVFQKTPDIFRLIGGKPSQVRAVKVSNTMRLGSGSNHETLGVWESDKGLIVIKRSQLKHLKDYAGTLLHEAAHSTSGANDATLAFEHALTELLGIIAARKLK